MRPLTLALTLVLLLHCTPQIPEEEVMCTVTFELVFPEGLSVSSTNMVFSCTNANSLEEVYQSSITTCTFTQRLRQGYYHLIIEGYAVTMDRQRVKLRCVVEQFSALDETLTYPIILKKIGS